MDLLESGQVEHNSRDVYYRSITGAVEAHKELRLTLRIKAPANIQQVLIRFWKEGTGEIIHKMTLRRSEGEESGDTQEYLYDYVFYTPEKGGLLWYYFIINEPDATSYYGNNPERWGGLGCLSRQVPAAYQITVYDQGAKTPDWFKHTVMYQIFPDRFYREGNQFVEKRGAVIHTCWEDCPCYYKDPDTKEIMAYDFFGGNIKGIRAKLPYLKELGISVIYFNPVFESESNHHYDTGNYHKIDPMLGTNEEFRQLVEEAKEEGIRIIIDGVFSHTGSNSLYFNRQGQYHSMGAYQTKESPYYEWYDFRNYPHEYNCWWNFDTLPNVKETTPSYMDFIIFNEDSVLHHWLKEGISGWRLDVIDELPQEFSQAFYKELKAADPDAVMIGEVWEDASNKVAYGVPREYLSGHEMDSAMNYPFRTILFDYLRGYIDGDCCNKRMECLRENYPKENFYAMMNLIGSHDVPRAITVLAEAPFYDGMPAVEQERFRLSGDAYNLGMARLLMAALWQMTYPGVPCVYYGDEIAMQGFKDPYNRRPYDWKNGEPYVRDWYRKCIKLRNDHMALQTGEIIPLYSKGSVYAYARVIRNRRDVFGARAENEAFVVAFNNHKTKTVTINLSVDDFSEGVFRNVFRAHDIAKVREGKLTLKVPPLKGIIYEEIKAPRKYDRMAGVLLHPTSLPSDYGIGDIGEAAYKFVDFLAEAGQKIWQLLPLVPVNEYGSPYQSPSAFAGNTMLISIDMLVKHHYLTKNDVKAFLSKTGPLENYEKIKAFKRSCLKKTFNRAMRQATLRRVFEQFCRDEAFWLEDYALFQVAKQAYNGLPWNKWPEEIRLHRPRALTELKENYQAEYDLECFMQCVFFVEWRRLKEYASFKGVKIMGDVPIFMSHDSADVWANQSAFNLDKDGSPKTVAGVPPDYFSETGQLWGNPHYRWDVMKKDGYSWWKKRFKNLNRLVDIIRIDHFRGFANYWEVDAGAETAVDGRWKKGPGLDFFKEIRKAIPDLELVAENLGEPSDAVDKLLLDTGLPGMKVLQFDLLMNEAGRLGYTCGENSVVYTGTHDNNTTVGWFTEDIDDRMRANVVKLLGTDGEKPADIAAALVELAYASNGRMAIIPMQDLLALDSQNRMNLPGTVEKNWQWRLQSDYRWLVDAAALKKLCDKYQR